MRTPCIYILIAVFWMNALGLKPVMAGELVVPAMPKAGTMVALSTAYTPALLQGMTIHPDDPFKFDFLIDKGDGNLTPQEKREEYNKLIKYFLAALTIPDKDQWVNLSPYEHNRIIEDNFGKTEMGRDLLAQDYFLKQITSSLMYPESGMGKSFWNRVFAEAHQKFGNTNIPVNAFNKVWIMPEEAVVYENKDSAVIIKSHLKVMVEEDYLAVAKNLSRPGDTSKKKCPQAGCQAGEPFNVRATEGKDLTQTIIKETILPELEKEVNTGKNFAPLRQMVSGMLLATWFKKSLRESLLGKVYADKHKVAGANQIAPQAIEAVYQEYLMAVKKGVYNYIKDDEDQFTHQIIPRKYFAGGFERGNSAMTVTQSLNSLPLSRVVSRAIDRATVTMLRPAETNGGAVNQGTRLKAREPYMSGFPDKYVKIVRDVNGKKEVVAKGLVTKITFDGREYYQVRDWSSKEGRLIPVDGNLSIVPTADEDLIDDTRIIVAALANYLERISVAAGEGGVTEISFSSNKEPSEQDVKMIRDILELKAREFLFYDVEWSSDGQTLFLKTKISLEKSREMVKGLGNSAMTTEPQGKASAQFTGLIADMELLSEAMKDCEKSRSDVFAAHRSTDVLALAKAQGALQARLNHLTKLINPEFDPHFLGFGVVGFVFKLTKNGQDYVVKFGHPEQIREEVRALKVLRGQALFQQYIAHDVSNREIGWIVSEFVQGVHLASNTDMFQEISEQRRRSELLFEILKGITDQHWEQLVEIFDTISKLGVSFESSPENIIYSSKEGFHAIDFNSISTPKKFTLPVRVMYYSAWHAFGIFQDYDSRNGAFIREKIDTAYERYKARLKSERQLTKKNDNGLDSAMNGTQFKSRAPANDDTPNMESIVSKEKNNRRIVESIIAFLNTKYNIVQLLEIEDQKTEGGIDKREFEININDAIYDYKWKIDSDQRDQGRSILHSKLRVYFLSQVKTDLVQRMISDIDMLMDQELANSAMNAAQEKIVKDFVARLKSNNFNKKELENNFVRMLEDVYQFYNTKRDTGDYPFVARFSTNNDQEIQRLNDLLFNALKVFFDKVEGTPYYRHFYSIIQRGDSFHTVLVKEEYGATRSDYAKMGALLEDFFESVLDGLYGLNVKGVIVSLSSAGYAERIKDLTSANKVLLRSVIADLMLSGPNPAVINLMARSRLSVVMSALGISSSNQSAFINQVNQAISALITENPAMTSTGGIDLDASKFDLLIKRDGRGVVLPLASQDLAQISRSLNGLEPRIIEIQPAVNVPVLNEIKKTLHAL